MHIVIANVELSASSFPTSPFPTSPKLPPVHGHDGGCRITPISIEARPLRHSGSSCAHSLLSALPPPPGTLSRQALQCAA